MNKLSQAGRANILQLLCEGMSMRAVTRATGASKNTVAKLLNDAGRALGEFQDAAFRDLNCKRVQVDEIWSFTYAKERNVPLAKKAPEGAGDTWTWTAIDADTKLVFSTLIGPRDSDSAIYFMEDIKARVADRIQLTSDGLLVYFQAVKHTFKGEVDYAQIVKLYGAAPGPKGRYSPALCVGAKKKRISGRPARKHISTSYVERQNLTMRMHMRRFTRLTNGFSKKLESHINAVALHMAYYNFVRIHQTLRVTPAMAAGVTKRLWEMADLVAIVEAAETVPAKRGPYRKHAAV
jgi:IS1 family transposase